MKKKMFGQIYLKQERIYIAIFVYTTIDITSFINLL